MGDKCLGSVIEAFCKPRELPLAKGLRSLHNLFRLLKIKEDSSFITNLTHSQRHAVALLAEWWTRSFEKMLDFVKKCILVHALFQEPPEARQLEVDKLEQLMPDQDRPLSEQVRQALSDPDSEVTEHVAAMRIDILQISFYHDSMFGFLQSELGGEEQTRCPELYHELVQPLAEVAAAMRYSHAILTEYQQQSLQRIHESPGEGQQVKKPTGESWREGIPTILKPCPWLQNSTDVSTSDPLTQLPAYLWDVEAERTVETATLQDPADINYAIISHTWGRWRKPGKGSRIPGVTLWLVPENTRFEVQELPGMLRRAAFAEKYLWMDLLCIPQNPTDERLAKISLLEIARQAIIFKRATTAVAWINDVETWAGTEAAISFIGLQWLKTSTYTLDKLESIDSALLAAADKASRPCELLAEASHPGEPRLFPGWLSSLWTLQETIMRPDMYLLDRHWEPLKVGRGLPISLVGLVALTGDDIQASSRRLDDDEFVLLLDLPRPRAVRELDACLTSSGILELTRATRLTAMVLGRNRACTSSRAQAIMSVTDATDWHMGRSVAQFISNQAEGDLVLGLYPQQFVEEMRRKTGATFFMCKHEIPTLTYGQDPKNKMSSVSVALKGTMLPFMPNLAGKSNAFNTSTGSNGDIDHPSVSTWRIQLDGNVVLSKVCMIASSPKRGDSMGILDGYSVTVHGNDPRDQQGLLVARVPVTEIQDWLVKFPGEAHAVCTMRSNYMLQGIILHRWERESDLFVKAGVFKSWPKVGSEPFKVPSPTTVNWIVV